jgi:hypothetical protein
MADHEQTIRNWSAFVTINLGMLAGTVEGITQSLDTMNPEQRERMARELAPSLDRVERVLAQLRSFLTPHKN